MVEILLGQFYFKHEEVEWDSLQLFFILVTIEFKSSSEKNVGKLAVNSFSSYICITVTMYSISYYF